MTHISFAFMSYMMIQCAVFGLLLGIAAENVVRVRHAVFLWILACFWPLILAWKMLCGTEKHHG